MNKPYGQVAYEAYAEQQDWKAHDGSTIPDWSEVRPDIKIAWDKAVDAAIEKYWLDQN